MEAYLDWIIDEKRVSTGFLSDGLVKLDADIYPNVETLYCFLKENDIVSTSYSYLISIVKSSIYRYSNLRSLSYQEEKDLKILNAMVEFSNIERHRTIKSAHSILSISSTGSSRTERRAMNKIKEWIRDSLPNPRKKLIEHLKRKKLISANINPFCEILSKDI